MEKNKNEHERLRTRVLYREFFPFGYSEPTVRVESRHS